jgi:hypothetical protein
MVKFEVLWNNLVDYLKSKAAGLGVSDTAIVKGAPGKAPPPPPFVYVRCLPGESDEDNAGNLNYGIAEITVFCGVKPEKNTEDAIIKATQLAGRVRTALIESDYCADPLPPDFVESSSNHTVMSFEFTSLFDPYEDLISE